MLSYFHFISSVILRFKFAPSFRTYALIYIHTHIYILSGEFSFLPVFPSVSRYTIAGGLARVQKKMFILGAHLNIRGPSRFSRFRRASLLRAAGKMACYSPYQNIKPSRREMFIFTVSHYASLWINSHFASTTRRLFASSPPSLGAVRALARIIRSIFREDVCRESGERSGRIRRRNYRRGYWEYNCYLKNYIRIGSFPRRCLEDSQFLLCNSKITGWLNIFISPNVSVGKDHLVSVILLFIINANLDDHRQDL